MDAEKAKNQADRDDGWKQKIDSNEDDYDDFKNAEFKINKKGEMEPVTASNPLTIDDIKVTGSKSSLRRLADPERNVTVLANRISTTDGAETDADDDDFENIINKTMRFKKEVRFSDDVSFDSGDTVSLNGGLTLGSTAREVIQDQSVVWFQVTQNQVSQ